MQKADFNQWRNSPVGKWFFDTILVEEIAERDAAIGSGSALSIDPHELAFNYTQEVGITAGLTLVRRLDPFKDDNEDSSNRPTAPD